MIFANKRDIDQACEAGFRFDKAYKPAFFMCAECKQNCPCNMTGNGGTGYASDDAGALYCYACCAIRDARDMEKTGRAVLYLQSDGKTWEVTNWPSTLRIPCRVKKGAHNWARVRYDAWFKHAGANWYGVSYGDNTQILRAKKVKS